VNYQYNPYAAPQAAPPVAQGAPGGQGPQPWTVGEVLSIAWDRFKQFWPVVVFSYVLSLVIGQIVGGVQQVLIATGAIEPGSSSGISVQIAFFVVGQMVAAYFQVGLTRIHLEAARGQSPSFGLLFSGGDRFLALFAFTLLYGLIVGVGILLLIVPGIFFALAFAPAQFYVVDQRMGPIAAMQASWEATKGQKGDIFLLGLAGFGLGLLGLVMCLVGVFATFPLAMVAYAAMYTRISGNGPAPAMYAYATPGMPPAPAPQLAPPAGGYGGPPGYGPPPGGGYGGPPGYGPPPGST
jgi:hypothetical protein